MSGRLLLFTAAVVALTSENTLAAPPPAPVAPAADASALELVNAASQAKAAAAASAEAAAKAREELAAVGTERKAIQARITQSGKDLKSHAASGTGAAKSYDTAAKAGKAAEPAAGAALDKARGELSAAAAAGDEAVKDTKSLRKLEESSAKKLGDVLAAAAAAKASADAAKSVKARLHQKASTDTSAAQKLAATAQSAATSAATAAGISALGYAAKSAKADGDAQKLLSDLRVLEQSLRALKSAPGGTAAPAAKPAPLKQCDLRKVDFNKYFPATSEDTGDGTHEYGVVSVEYADLDGDGSVEALVHAMHSYLGLTASQQWELNVMTRDKDCNVSLAGSYTGALCAEMTRAGNVLTLNDGCEGFVAEYRLVQGTMKETKRRRQ